MNLRAFTVIVGISMLICGCSGGSNKTPSIKTSLTAPQTYPQEDNSYNNPGSLYAASDSDTLFSDSRARRVGDIVIVKIVENTKAQHKAETTADKNSNNNFGVTAMFGAKNVIPFLNIGKIGAEPMLGTSSVSSTSATGKTKRENYVTTSMATRVVRVLPGGLLQIEGAREIRVNDETEYLVVRGMVRAKDVSSDNSILSTQIADASIEYYGKGALADKQRAGWLTRLVENVWPF